MPDSKVSSLDARFSCVVALLDPPSPPCPAPIIVVAYELRDAVESDVRDRCGMPCDVLDEALSRYASNDGRLSLLPPPDRSIASPPAPIIDGLRAADPARGATFCQAPDSCVSGEADSGEASSAAVDFVLLLGDASDGIGMDVGCVLDVDPASACSSSREEEAKERLDGREGGSEFDPLEPEMEAAATAAIKELSVTVRSGRCSGSLSRPPARLANACL